jgi:DNA-binding transcriptional ArsR family regulator
VSNGNKSGVKNLQADPILRPKIEENELVEQLADLFSLMGDPTRLRIIMTCLREPINVSDIASGLSLSQPLVSHHLRLLKAARMVRAERRGKQIFYVAADAHVQCVIDDMVAHFSEPVAESVS